MPAVLRVEDNERGDGTSGLLPYGLRPTVLPVV